MPFDASFKASSLPFNASLPPFSAPRRILAPILRRPSTLPHCPLTLFHRLQASFHCLLLRLMSLCHLLTPIHRTLTFFVSLFNASPWLFNAFTSPSNASPSFFNACSLRFYAFPITFNVFTLLLVMLCSSLLKMTLSHSKIYIVTLSVLNH